MQLRIISDHVSTKSVIVETLLPLGSDFQMQNISLEYIRIIRGFQHRGLDLASSSKSHKKKLKSIIKCQSEKLRASNKSNCIKPRIYAAKFPKVKGQPQIFIKRLQNIKCLQ